MYKVDGRMFTIPKNVIEKFRVWNEKDEYQTGEYDKRFVHALLLVMADESSLATSSVNNTILEFITSMLMWEYFIWLEYFINHFFIIRIELLEVRANGDQTRVNAISDFTNEIYSKKATVSKNTPAN